MLDFSIYKRHHELARKTVHITFAVLFSATYYFVGKELTAIFALIVGLLLLTSHAQKIFKLIHQYLSVLYDVGRRSWGEVYYAFGISASALITGSIGEFITVIAIIAFADSAASLIGKAITSPSLKFYDAKASIAGSTAFFVVTIIILMLSKYVGIHAIELNSLLATCLLLAGIEAVSPYGSDNFFVPLVGAFVLFL